MNNFALSRGFPLKAGLTVLFLYLIDIIIIYKTCGSLLMSAFPYLSKYVNHRESIGQEPIWLITTLVVECNAYFLGPVLLLHFLPKWCNLYQVAPPTFQNIFCSYI